MSKLLATEIGPVDYAELGPPDGPAVIFLHHGFGTRHSLVNLATGLTPRLPGLRVIHYSRPGSGASPPMAPARPPDYLTREAVSVLPSVMDALDIAKADLVGHSDGGSIALIAGALHPGRVKSISAIAPHIIVEDRTVEGIRSLPCSEDAPAFHRSLSRKHADVAVAYESWRDLWLSPAMRGWDITPFLPGIHCPVGLLQGAKDEYGTFLQLDLIEAGLPNAPVASTRLDDAGHEPHKSHPNAVIRLCFDTIQTRVVSKSDTQKTNVPPS